MSIALIPRGHRARLRHAAVGLAATTLLVPVLVTLGATGAAAVTRVIGCFDTSPAPGYKVINLTYTGATQTVNIPAGVTSVSIDICGAAGGSNNDPGFPQFNAAGGPGGETLSTVPIAGATSLDVLLGQNPAPGVSARTVGGGGESTQTGGTSFQPGSGGGGSYVSTGGALVLAAGGGGGADTCSAPGGAGGGVQGSSGGVADGNVVNCGDAGSTPGGGGTQTAGGAGGQNIGNWAGSGSAGSAFQGGDSSAPYGSGGGGGYYGGGGGVLNGAAGGGSAFVLNDPSCTGCTPGVNSGSGAARIVYADTTITTHASATTTIGSGISDTATVTVASGPPPTGNVTFDMFGPDNATCTGTPARTISQPVDANGDAHSGNLLPTDAGTYQFVATYSGDPNHPAAVSPCGSQNESVIVSKASPTVTTSATPSAPVGSPISDTATITSGYADSGTVTISLFGPNDTTCAGPATFTSAKPVANDGDYVSDPYTPTVVGTYRWRASYSGDGNNNGAATPCNDTNETTVVDQAGPTLTTQASAATSVGNDLTDVATLSGGYNPTGTIDFALYGPNDASCTGPVAFTSSTPVSGNGNYTSDPFSTAALGTYRWRASYSGDGNNTTLAPACNAPNESTAVAKAAPTLTTQATASAAVGSAISDTATVALSYNATGTVTFDLFGPAAPSCTGTPLASSTQPVAGNGDYNSDPYVATVDGSYHWVATYSGGANNVGQAGACGDANETTTVTPGAGPGGGGGGSTAGTTGGTTGASPSVSPSASRSPSSSASPSSSGARQNLTLDTGTPNIPAGSTATLMATGAANQLYELRCYTRPSTTYVTSREGSFDDAGTPVTFTLSLGRNTRCFIQYATNSGSGASPSVAINVRTVLSLSTVRTAVRTYTFQGRNLPRVSGQLIPLYRVDNAGNEIRTSNLVTDDSGTYRVTREFTDTGTFQFKVRTSHTLNNGAGVSNTITVTVH